MSDNFFRVNKGVELNPSHAPTSPQSGQIYLDNSDNKVKTVGPTQAVDYNTGIVIELNPEPLIDPISGLSYVTVFTQTESFLYKANPLNAPGSGGYHRFSVNDEPVMTVNYSDVVLEAPSVGGATKLTIKYNSNASPGNLSTVSILPENNPAGELITAEVRLPVTVSGDVLVGRTTTDTFTNKTFDIDDNSFEINGTPVTTSTGSGGFVLETSPTLITPNLGVPSSVDLTNASNLPVSAISGVGVDMQNFLTTPSSANLATAIADGTGTGAAVFADTPTLITPIIGDATATSITGSNSANLTIESDPAYNLEVQGVNVLIKSFDNSSSVSTGSVEIYTGDQSGIAVSGTINIKTGNTDLDGSGNVVISTGNTNAPISGSVTISTGTSASSTRGDIDLDAFSINVSSDTINFGVYDSPTSAYPLQMSSGPLSGQTILEFQYADAIVRSRNEFVGGTKGMSFSTGIAGDFTSPPLDSGNSGTINFTTGTATGTSTGRSGTLLFGTGDVYGTESSGDMIFLTGQSNGTTSGGNMYFETGMNNLQVAPRGLINFSANSFAYFVGEYYSLNAGDLIDTTGYYLGVENSTNTPRSLRLAGGFGNAISVNAPQTLQSSYAITLPDNAPNDGDSFVFDNYLNKTVWKPTIPGNDVSARFQFNSTTSIVYGGVLASTSGTTTAVPYDSTTFLGRIPTIQFNSATATGATTGCRVSNGSPVAVGAGFYFETIFQITDTATVSNSRHFCGFNTDSGASGYNNAINNYQLGSAANLFGMAYDAFFGDTNFYIYHNDSVGSAQKINLGPDFPITNTGEIFHVTFYSPQGENKIYYNIKAIVSGAVANGSVTTNLPQTVLYTHNERFSGGSNASVRFKSAGLTQYVNS
jgi:hypothetical protein